MTAWYGRDAWAKLLSHGVECEGGHRAVGAGSGRGSCGSRVCIYLTSSSRYAQYLRCVQVKAAVRAYGRRLEEWQWRAARSRPARCSANSRARTWRCRPRPVGGCGRGPSMGGRPAAMGQTTRDVLSHTKATKNTDGRETNPQTTITNHSRSQTRDTVL